MSLSIGVDEIDAADTCRKLRAKSGAANAQASRQI
jgi:hypothetical protein